MAVCTSTPNFLWRIENFASIYTKVSPAILMEGFKWQVRFSRYKDVGVDNILLILKCEAGPEMLRDWYFKTEVSVAKPSSGADLHRSQTAKYAFKNKDELCIWSGNVSLIYSSVGQIKDVIFAIVISPIGDLEDLFKNKKCGEEVIPESLCVRSLIDDFGKLFNNCENHDFVLKCGERNFHVHKAVLTARSDFFAGMFRCNMKETTEGTGKIENIEPDILEIVLRYMYNGEIAELTMKSLHKVYAAADRFGVESLKIKCYSLFIENFVICPKESSDVEVEKETCNVNNQTKIVEKERDKTEEKKFLKDLFMSNEWRSFSQEFPYKAQEMCRPYLLKM